MMRALKDIDVRIAHGRIDASGDHDLRDIGPSTGTPGRCLTDLFLQQDMEDCGITDEELLDDLILQLRSAIAMPVMITIEDVFDSACTQLSIRCSVDSAGRGRPRVIYDTSHALDKAGCAVFMADMFVDDREVTPVEENHPEPEGMNANRSVEVHRFLIYDAVRGGSVGNHHAGEKEEMVREKGTGGPTRRGFTTIAHGSGSGSSSSSSSQQTSFLEGMRAARGFEKKRWLLACVKHIFLGLDGDPPAPVKIKTKQEQRPYLLSSSIDGTNIGTKVGGPNGLPALMSLSSRPVAASQPPAAEAAAEVKGEADVNGTAMTSTKKQHRPELDLGPEDPHDDHHDQRGESRDHDHDHDQERRRQRREQEQQRQQERDWAREEEWHLERSGLEASMWTAGEDGVSTSGDDEGHVEDHVHAWNHDHDDDVYPSPDDDDDDDDGDEEVVEEEANAGAGAEEEDEVEEARELEVAEAGEGKELDEDEGRPGENGEITESREEERDHTAEPVNPPSRPPPRKRPHRAGKGPRGTGKGKGRAR